MMLFRKITDKITKKRYRKILGLPPFWGKKLVTDKKIGITDTAGSPECVNVNRDQ